MKRHSAVLALALAGVSSSAGAVVPEFVGIAGLREALGAFRAQALQQKLLAAAPLPAQTGPDVTPYPVRGIDVSAYQNQIDWKRVQAAGVSFAFIKATEGTEYKDEMFSLNWNGAAGAGLYRGAYHFYNFCKDGPSQAANFIATVPNDAKALPPVVDLEKSGSCQSLPPRDVFRPQLAAFLARVQAFYGKAPILYVNYSIYDLYFSGADDPYRIWIADPRNQAPLSTGSAGWTFWQYSFHGQVAGITGDVDLDVFNGTVDMLAALSSSSSAARVEIAEK